MNKTINPVWSVNVLYLTEKQKHTLSYRLRQSYAEDKEFIHVHEKLLMADNDDEKKIMQKKIFVAAPFQHTISIHSIAYASQMKQEKYYTG